MAQYCADAGPVSRRVCGQTLILNCGCCYSLDIHAVMVCPRLWHLALHSPGQQLISIFAGDLTAKTIY